MHSRLLLGLCLFPVLAYPSLTTWGADRSQPGRSPAEVFPKSCVVFVEVKQPAKVIGLIMDHPLREKIEQIDEVRKGLDSKQMKQLQGVIALIEGHVGMKWREAIAFATADGLYFAFDPETEGVAMIARSSDEKQLKQMMANLVKLAKLDADSAKTINEKDYRGLKAYEVRKTIIAVMGNNLMVSNKSELAKQIADNYLDGTSDSLASNEQFVSAQQNHGASAAAWAYFDLEKIRHAPQVQKALEGKPENIVAEMLLGGLQSTLQQTPYGTAELELSSSSIKLTAAVPHDPQWTPKAREYFFGPEGKGKSPDLLVPTDTLLNITAYRDISKLWLSKEDLLSEKEISQLAQADSMFSTLFGGLDFGQEVLGATKPGVQVIAKRQDFSKIKTPTPEIKLPAFAFVFQLKNPEEIQRRFKVGFQSLIGFVNIQLGQQEMAQLDIETVKRDNAVITSATYLPEKNNESGLINYNFSPTIAFKKDYFIVSSTAELANELIDLADQPLVNVGDSTNALLRIDGQVLADILAENRESLISQNMLEEGHDRQQAETEIGVLINLMKMTNQASMRFASEADELKLQLEFSLQN